MPKFTVAIAGAGLCGLVFALALEKYAPDVDFEIYEATAQLSTAGAGIGVPPRTWYILEKLGLEESLLQLSGNGTKPKMPVLYRKSDQPDGFQFHQGDSSAEDNLTFHRPDMQRIFLENLRSAERIHLRKRVVSYTQPSDGTGKIEIQFQDGTTATCDILVGADGIKSRVRTTLYTHLANVAQAKGDSAQAEELRSCIPAVYSGASVFRGVLKREHVDGTLAHLFDAESSIVMYCGKNKHVVAYPIQQGQGLNVAAIVAQYELANTIYEGPWVHDADRETVKETYTGWEPVIMNIMQNMRTWSKWAINVVKKLPTFVDGQVALLADAAHAMTPHQGAGAGQGFEDALLLAQLLGQPRVDVAALPIALKIYDQTRRPVVQEVADLCLTTGMLHAFITPALEGVTPEMSHLGNGITKEQLQDLAVDIEHAKDWRKGTTVEEDCNGAISRLNEELSSAVA